MKSRDLLEFHIVEHSSNIFGRDVWPNYIEFSIFFIFSLFVTYDCYFEFSRKPKKANHSKRFFLLTFCFYLILHNVLMIAPFPYNEFFLSFLSDELPVFLLFISWSILASWLGSALILQNNESKAKKIIIVVIFSVVFSLLFVYTLITQILIHATDVWKTTDEDLLAYFPLAAHIIGLVIIFPINMFYFVKLWRLHKDENIVPQIKTRIKILYILLFVLFIAFLTRFLIEFLALVLFGQIHGPIMEKYFYNPCRESDKCFMVSWYTAVMALLKELIPIGLLYSTFQVLNKPLSKPKKIPDPIDRDPSYYASLLRGGRKNANNNANGNNSNNNNSSNTSRSSRRNKGGNDSGGGGGRGRGGVVRGGDWGWAGGGGGEEEYDAFGNPLPPISHFLERDTYNVYSFPGLSLNGSDGAPTPPGDGDASAQQYFSGYMASSLPSYFINNNMINDSYQ